MASDDSSLDHNVPEHSSSAANHAFAPLSCAIGARPVSVAACSPVICRSSGNSAIRIVLAIGPMLGTKRKMSAVFARL